ncbi:Sir2 family protein [Plectosphaerella plurivora]|uniref:Sir2 family protein n=1 Tax=Plectosphaerella plurivora TaxID=936078 RepID=A0A9P8VHD4_9PEZI|nr:Sir2 family protein [Plectosphaerella plurivora]
MPSSDVAAFHALLSRNPSPRILALCGAGLSASSGLPTFRGAGGLWRNKEAVALANFDAFTRDPAQVWLFYAYRRHAALTVKPNAAHRALAALAEKQEHFLCLTQNVDIQDLSQRAGHPLEKLRTLHGNLFTIKCSNRRCGYIEHNNTLDPIVSALAPASETPPTDPSVSFPLLDPFVPLPPIEASELPRCPSCSSLARPGVVWFGEALDFSMLEEIDSWIDREPVDVILVIGTTAQVYPAAGYVDKASRAGAKVCVVNIEVNKRGLRKDDFAFEGDAVEILPRLLEPLIGRMRKDGTFKM